MKIQIVSDFHTEFSFLKIKRTDCDVLVMAGDMVVPSQVEKLVSLVKGITCPIIYVAGNHEYYGGVIEEVQQRIREVTCELKNFHFLENESIDINGVRFLGTTLWSNFDLASGMDDVERSIVPAISDFRLIRTKPNKSFSAEDCVTLNHEARHFLYKEILRAFVEDYQEKLVIVTHFCPSELSIAPQFIGNPMNAYFTCKCDYLMRAGVSLWIHGHTHSSVDYLHSGNAKKDVRVVANPRGYHTENKTFQGKFVVEI